MRHRHLPALVVLLTAAPASLAVSPAPAAQDVYSPIDLVEIQLVVPRTVTVGKTFRVLDEVENQGTGVAFETITGFFLSEDQVADSGDVGVGGHRVPQLGPRRSHSATTPVTLKSTIKPGEYYFVAVADAKRELDERSRLDNMRAVPITVLPAEGKDKK